MHVHNATQVINYAPELEPQRENPSLFPADHNAAKVQHITETVTPVEEYPIMIDLVYGVHPGGVCVGVCTVRQIKSTRNHLAVEHGLRVAALG